MFLSGRCVLRVCPDSIPQKYADRSEGFYADRSDRFIDRLEEYIAERIVPPARESQDRGNMRKEAGPAGEHLEGPERKGKNREEGCPFLLPEPLWKASEMPWKIDVKV